MRVIARKRKCEFYEFYLTTNNQKKNIKLNTNKNYILENACEPYHCSPIDYSIRSNYDLARTRAVP